MTQQKPGILTKIWREIKRPFKQFKIPAGEHIWQPLHIPLEPLAVPESSVGERAKLFANRRLALSLIPKNSVVAEIGVAYGGFSVEILRSLEPSKFYAIDNFSFQAENEPWGETCLHDSGLTHREYFCDRFSKEIANNQMKIMEGLSWESLALLGDDSLDFAYLDADHRYDSVVKDIKILHKKVKDGGYIQFNDYTMFDYIAGVHYGVIQAVNQLLNCSSHQIVAFSLSRNGFHDITIQLNKSDPVNLPW